MLWLVSQCSYCGDTVLQSRFMDPCLRCRKGFEDGANEETDEQEAVSQDVQSIGEPKPREE